MNEDARFKLGLESLLGKFISVVSQHEVQSPSQFVDVFLAEQPSKQTKQLMWNTLGWLGKMAEQPSLLEGFSHTISLEEARDCLRKQLTLYHSSHLPSESKKVGNSTVPRLEQLPRLWLVSTGKPNTLIRGWGMVPLKGWPFGFYQTPPGFEVRLVVVSELPQERETLPLRFFGGQKVKKSLAGELLPLKKSDPMRLALGEMLVFWSIWVQDQPEQVALRRFLMNFQSVIQERIQEIVAKGKSEGKREGLEEGEAKGLRVAIRDLCEIYGIELTKVRQQQLVEMKVSALEKIRQEIKSDKQWPAYLE
jgi:hypothetical protein